MKRWFSNLLVIATLALSVTIPTTTLTGCLTRQKETAIKTLFTLGESVDSSYKGYLDLVVTGKLPTNSVPQISRQYQLFQSAFNLAVTASTLSSNAPPSVQLANAANQLIIAIQAETAKKAK